MEINNSPSNTPAMSEDIRLFGQAFIEAKKEFTATGLGGNNAHQKYKYATIGDIYNGVEHALLKNNLFIVHFARSVDLVEYLYTRIVHSLSGQYIEDMRKYAVLSLCAIATEDDDGEDEVRYIEKKTYAPALTSEQIKELQDKIKESPNAKELYAKIMSFYKVSDLRELKTNTFLSIKNYIDVNKK
jgi:hypothetical protein